MLSNNCSEVQLVFHSSPCLRIWEMWTLLSGFKTSPAAYSHQTVLHLAEILVSQAGWGQGQGKVPLGTRGCSWAGKAPSGCISSAGKTWEVEGLQQGVRAELKLSALGLSVENRPWDIVWSNSNGSCHHHSLQHSRVPWGLLGSREVQEQMLWGTCPALLLFVPGELGCACACACINTATAPSGTWDWTPLNAYWGPWKQEW